MGKTVKKRRDIRRRRYASAARRVGSKPPRPGRYESLADYIRNGPETQVQFAKRLRISQSTLSRIAAGADCSLSLAKLISRLSGVKLERIGSDLV